MYKKESEDLQFLPYYTDGGVQDYGDYLFIENMSTNAEPGDGYSTHQSRGANVVVKSIFSGKTIEQFKPQFPLRYKPASCYQTESENVYICQHILDEYSPAQQHCVVNAMKVAFEWGTTFPVQYLLVFLGIDAGAENLEKPYFDLKSLEDVQLKSIEQKIPLKATGSNESFDFAVFSQMGNSMQPAIWIGYKDLDFEDFDDLYGNDEDSGKIQVDFPNVFIAKHMHVLLIDAQPQSHSNIDVSYVVPGGFLLK